MFSVLENPNSVSFRDRLYLNILCLSTEILIFFPSVFISLIWFLALHSNRKYNRDKCSYYESSLVVSSTVSATSQLTLPSLSLFSLIPPPTLFLSHILYQLELNWNSWTSSSAQRSLKINYPQLVHISSHTYSLYSGSQGGPQSITWPSVDFS